MNNLHTNIEFYKNLFFFIYNIAIINMIGWV
nr:MAG TPA: hypothetical protein [Bacteriophage sp.]